MIMYKSVVALAALAAAPALASPAVNVYFGQSGINRLSSYCQQDGFEYVTLAFVNNSPEQDESGLDYPGTNFAGHCSSEVYINTKNGKPSKLLSGCNIIAEDIPVCQSLGKKVLLSIGGAWINGTDYTVTGMQRGQDFAKFLWGAFGPYDSAWNGPRPFDLNGVKVAVDGFDFDIEHNFPDQTGYLALLTTLRSLAGDKYLITGAPQCPISSGNDMATMIMSVAFDVLFVQFYNNPVCDGIPNNTPGDSFNFDEWVSFISKGASKNAKLFIGLPGAPAGPQSTETGYLEPAAAISLINQYKTRPSFGGVMIWDVDSASAKTSSGRTYYQAIHDAVVGSPATTTTTASATSSASSIPSCGATYTVKAGDNLSAIGIVFGLTVDQLQALNSIADVNMIWVGQVLKLQPACSSTSSTWSSTRATSTASSTTSTASTTSSTSSVSSASSSSSALSTSTSASSSSASSSASSSSSSASSARLSTSSVRSSVSSTSSSASSFSSYTSSSSSSVSSTRSLVSASSSSSKEGSLGISSSTTTSTSTKSPSSSVPSGKATSTSASPSGSPSRTPSGPRVTSSAESSSGLPFSTATASTTLWTNSTVSPATEAQEPTTTTSEVPLVTSTIYTSKVYTVTKCPDSVPNCPNRGSVSTEVVPLYTTLCPATEAQTTPAGSEPTGPPVVIGAECPGGVKCPIKGGEETTLTKITSYSTIHTTVSNPQSTSAPASHGDSTAQVSSSAAQASSSTTSTNVGSTSSASVKPSATPAVTAGAGRLAAALTLPAAIGALFLAL